MMRKVSSNNLEICYETFGDKKDRPLVLIMGLATQMIGWPEPFCRMLAEAGHFVVRVDNRDILIPLLEARFLEDTASNWVEKLEAKGVAVSPLHTLDQVFTHPQVLANDMLVASKDADGSPMPLVGMPFKMTTDEGTCAPSERPVPRLGAHTDEILRDVLGYSEADIRALRDAEAV